MGGAFSGGQPRLLHGGKAKTSLSLKSFEGGADSEKRFSLWGFGWQPRRRKIALTTSILRPADSDP